MNRIQLLAVDLDGTLVTGKDEISATTRAALHRLRGAGVELAIATGRRYRKTQGAVGSLGLPVPVVCLGGALVKGNDSSGKPDKAAIKGIILSGGTFFAVSLSITSLGRYLKCLALNLPSFTSLT